MDEQFEGYSLYGGMGSPYSMKMRALLRYRRIPHRWVVISRQLRPQLAHGGPPVIPILEFPDGSRRVDSTPLALELEERHSGRRVLPEDPALAFVCLLLEDFGDEWLTKAMFHYRWNQAVDQRYSSRQIIADNSPGLSGDPFDAAAEAIRQRQVERMPIVGCTPENAATIEETFLATLDALEGIALRDHYLLGTRPSLADFGLFGQLKTLCDDHTPHLIVRERQPRVYDWVRRLDDASGIDGEWSTEPSGAALALLHMVEEVYLPFLNANERALAGQESELQLQLLGRPWVQPTFRYQAKCLGALRTRYQALPPTDAERVGDWIGDSAVEVLTSR